MARGRRKARAQDGDWASSVEQVGHTGIASGLALGAAHTGAGAVKDLEGT